MAPVLTTSPLSTNPMAGAPSTHRGGKLHRPWQAITDSLITTPSTVTLADWTHLMAMAAIQPTTLARHITTQLPSNLPPASSPSCAVLWLTNHCELPPRLHRRAADTVWTLSRDTLDRTLAMQPERVVIGSHISSALQIPGFEHPNPTRQYEALLSHVKTVAPQAQLVVASIQELELWSVLTGCSLVYGLDLLADYGVSALTGFHEQPLVASWRHAHHPRLISTEDWLSVAQIATRKGMGLTMGLPVSGQVPPSVWQAHWSIVMTQTKTGAIQLGSVCPWVAPGDKDDRLLPNGQWLVAGLPAVALDIPLVQPWPTALPAAEYLLHETALQHDRAEQQDKMPWAQAPLPEWLAFEAVNANCWQGLETVWHQHFR
jgi:hypothetical protein